jgi:hypothetical protein
MYSQLSGQRIRYLFILALLTGLAVITLPLSADEKDLQKTLQRMEQLLQQQQQELEVQRRELAEQRALIQQLQQAQQAQDSDADRVVVSEPAAIAAPAPAEPGSGQEKALVEEKAVAELAENTQPGPVEEQTDKSDSQYDASNTSYSVDFVGAWPLPGTRSNMRIGGYVNLAVVNSFDPLLITDRFITGSIPPDGQDVLGAKAGMDVTANQTRLNLEVRQQTNAGPLRAFVEGDFEGNGDAFRLRHAFGQYKSMLAGKTWTTLMDVNSRPEEVDFEGINGQVLVRQSQLRFFPRFGQNMRFRFAVENPRTDVTNGTGVNGKADLVVSVDRLPLGTLGSWNSRVGFILRDLQGQNVTYDFDVPDDKFPTEKVIGWGVTTSGRRSLTWWGDEDFILWQLTYGKGIGRYINDLGTMGGGDAVFDPAGNLHALPVLAGYFSYQHRWPKDFWFLDKWPGIMRSNMTLSLVSIDNFEFQDDKNYQSTLRASLNLIYLPTENVRLGMELLWGQRKNKDDSKGTATQLQISARYDF